MRHVLSAVVQNVPGVLAHVSGMLASRGYNIDSLAVGETEDPNLSRMTFVVVGDDRNLWPREQYRSFHPADAAVQHPGACSHRPHRHGPRQTPAAAYRGRSGR